MIYAAGKDSLMSIFNSGYDLNTSTQVLRAANQIA